MKEIMLLLFAVVLTGVSAHAEEFVKKLYSDDSLICLESSGEVDGGTVHAGNTVTLVYDREDLGTFKTVFSSDKKGPYLPIFTEMQIVGNTSEGTVLVFALGWNSLGSGQEKITGWLIRFDMTPSIVDWFEIDQPRSYPGVAYDRKAEEIAILADKAKLRTLDRDFNSFSITLANGKKVDLADGAKKTVNHPGKNMALYDNHPFSERKNDVGIDSMLCVNKIIVAETGFAVATMKKDGN